MPTDNNEKTAPRKTEYEQWPGQRYGAPKPERFERGDAWDTGFGEYNPRTGERDDGAYQREDGGMFGEQDRSGWPSIEEIAPTPLQQVNFEKALDKAREIRDPDFEGDKMEAETLMRDYLAKSGKSTDDIFSAIVIEEASPYRDKDFVRQEFYRELRDFATDRSIELMTESRKESNEPNLRDSLEAEADDYREKAQEYEEKEEAPSNASNRAAIGIGEASRSEDSPAGAEDPAIQDALAKYDDPNYQPNQDSSKPTPPQGGRSGGEIEVV